jgi:hypothetical protein
MMSRISTPRLFTFNGTNLNSWTLRSGAPLEPPHGQLYLKQIEARPLTPKD